MMVRFRNILHRLAILGAMLCFAVACQRDDLVPLPGNDDDGKVRIELFTNSSEYAVPAVSKADETGLTYAPMVLVYTGTGQTAVFVEAAQSVLSGSITTVTLTPSDQPSLFVVIDNYSGALGDGTAFTEAGLNGLLQSSTLADLETLLRTRSLSDPQTANPYGTSDYLPMSGVSVGVNKIDEETKIYNHQDGTTYKMMLTRAVAKADIEVDASLSGFTVMGLGAVQVADNGSLYRYDFNVLNTGSYSPVSYRSASSAGDVFLTNARPLYFYETSAFTEPALIVKASLNSDIYYYKLGFVVAGDYIDIWRNKDYTFSITEAGPGYKTLDEAVYGPVSNIEYQIRVTDGTAHDMISNGQYYLGLSNSEVLNYGTNTTFNEAFVITTDCTPELGVNEITLTPSSGITITSPSNGKIYLSPSGVTSATINFTATALTFTGTIEVRVGNLTQTVTFRRRTYLPFSGYGELPYDNYVQCDLPSESRDWLKLKGTDNQRFANDKTFREGQKVYIDADQYTTSNGTREATFFMSRNAGGRAKIYVTQQGVDRSTVVHRVPDGGYVGAFWRASQTGERLIYIPYNEDIVGDWTATVVEGEDWIKLDMQPTADPGVTWVAGSENPADMIAHDALFQVPGDGLSVGGTVEAAGDKIYFRIGLRSTIPEGSEPRYGAILMSYAMKDQNTHYCYLYLRQGEQADYLYRPWDSNSLTGNGGWGDGTVHRPYAAKFSPFNITAQEYKDNHKYLADINSGKTNTDHPQVDTAVFVDYPTQVGAMFTFASLVNKKRAWHPIFPGGSNTMFFSDSQWPSVATDYLGDKTWDEIKDEHESCPTGYRRMRDHYDDANRDDNMAVANSEIRQSLFITPPANTQGVGNSTTQVCFYVGYYADGFFDRRGLVMNEAVSNHTPNHAASADGTLVAYKGALFYNKFNHASLFFPQGGSRAARGAVSDMGNTGRYWTSSTSASSYRGWIMVISTQNDKNTYMHGGIISFNNNTYRHGAYPIRCVKDLPYYQGN